MSNIKEIGSIIKRDLTTSEYKKFVKKCASLGVEYRILAYVSGYPKSIVTIVTEDGVIYDGIFKHTGYDRPFGTPEIVLAEFKKRE